MSLQNLLISEADINLYRTISPSVETAKRIVPFVQEAQELDLRPLVGDVFYSELLLQGTGVPLLEGEYYTDLNGHSIWFEGLRAPLAHWAYARFLENQQITVTSHSVVVKDNPYSTPIDSKTLSQRVVQVRSSAHAYWLQVEKYLSVKKSQNPTTLPFSLYTGIESAKSFESGIRITAIDSFTRKYSWTEICSRNCSTPCGSYLNCGRCV